MKFNNPEVYNSDNYVVLDFETTNYRYGDPLSKRNELVMASYLYKGKMTSVYADEFNQKELIKIIESCDFVIAQNAKFELQWLARCGLNNIDSIVVYDTMIGEYVIAGNVRKSFKLDDNCKRYNLATKDSLVSKLIKAGVCPSEIPKSWLIKYCEKDVEVCHELFKKQYKKITKLKLNNVMFSRCLITPALSDIERAGMTLDKDRLHCVDKLITSQFADVSIELQKYLKGASPTSPKQMAVFLYETMSFKELTGYGGKPLKTPKGKPLTDKTVYSKLKCKTNKQKDFLKLKLLHSKLNAKMTKTLKPLRDCAESTGNLQFNFNQCIAATHRLTSTGRNFKLQGQNMDGEMKPLWTCRNEGWVVMVPDYSTLEFGIAGFLGKDKRIYKDYKEDFDVHTFTASVINKLDEDEVTPLLRKKAKPHTFKPLFGGKSGTPDEKRYYETFETKYEGLTAEQNNWCQKVLSTGKLRLINGLICYWKGTKLQRSGFITNSTKIKNLPIQSLATADIAQLGVRFTWQRMLKAKVKSFIVNTIHDSIVMEVHPDEIDLIKEICQKGMVQDVYEYLEKIYGIKLDIPLKLDYDIGTHWEESKEFRRKYLNG